MWRLKNDWVSRDWVKVAQLLSKEMPMFRSGLGCRSPLRCDITISRRYSGWILHCQEKRIGLCSARNKKFTSVIYKNSTLLHEIGWDWQLLYIVIDNGIKYTLLWTFIICRQMKHQKIKLNAIRKLKDKKNDFNYFSFEINALTKRSISIPFTINLIITMFYT